MTATYTTVMTVIDKATNMTDGSPTDKIDVSSLQVEDPDGHYRMEGYRLGESLGYLIKRTTAMLSNAVEQELAPFDITHPQFSLLMILAERKCSTAADIARETCGDTGAMTRMLDRLEAKDIIRRMRSSEDRRVINIELTDTGKLVVERLPVVAINVMNRYLKDFSKDELEIMKTLLRRLLRNGGVEVAATLGTPLTQSE